jgi:response regulator RpfG family c-di-GMP phosphodiesterase
VADASNPWGFCLPQDSAEAELRHSAGTQFDPDVVEALLRGLREQAGDAASRVA